MSIERTSASGLSINMSDTGVQIQPPLTMSVWARVETDPDATLRGVVCFTAVSTALSGYNFMALSSKLHAYVRYVPSTWATVAASANVTTGKWYHLALRIFDTDPSIGDRVVEFFIDGVSQGTHATAFNRPDLLPPPDIRYSGTLKMHVGQYITSYLNCMAHGLAIWNLKLTDAEIAYLAGSRLHWAPAIVGQSATLRPHWPFDEMNDGENVASNPKNFFNRGKQLGATDYFIVSGSGNAYGRANPTIYGPGVSVMTFDTPAAAAFRGLALCGAGR